MARASYIVSARAMALGAQPLAWFCAAPWPTFSPPLTPGEVEHAIHPREDMIVGHELTQRTRHEQLQLTAFLPSEHAAFP